MCGAAGTTSICAAFRRWFEAGEKGDPPALEKNGESASAFIIRPDGRRIVYDQYGWYEVDPGLFAMGSGYEIALGAMNSGGGSVFAVRTAARFDSATNDEIDTLRL